MSYNYDERYMAQFTMRRDGSSRFGSDNLYGTFPSFSLGWNIMNEKFMEPTHNWLSYDVMTYCAYPANAGNTNLPTYIEQARLLRAYYYNILWHYYGDIPFYLTNLDSPYQADQISADKVYENLIAEMEDIIKNNVLPMRYDDANAGRVSPAFAYMLYTEMVMYQNDTARYPQALAYMKEIIDSGSYRLMDNFADIWKESGEWGSESIFEVNYQDDQAGRDWGSVCLQGWCLHHLVRRTTGWLGVAGSVHDTYRRRGRALLPHPQPGLGRCLGRLQRCRRQSIACDDECRLCKNIPKDEIAMYKKLFALISLCLVTAVMRAADDMDAFISRLMSRMTFEEKVGQLNLLPGGDITTGAVMNSPMVALIEKGQLGAVLNIKGADKIKALQEVTVKHSRLGIPLLIGFDIMIGPNSKEVMTKVLGVKC